MSPASLLHCRQIFYCWVTGETTHVCIHILFHMLFHYGLSQESEYSFLLLYSSTLLLKILSLLIIKIHGMSYISNGSISRKRAFIKTEVWKWRQTTLAKKEERTGVLSYPTLVQSGIWKTNTLVFVLKKTKNSSQVAQWVSWICGEMFTCLELRMEF